MSSEKRISDIRAPRGQTKPRAGGAAGDAVRDRLRRLITVRGESQAAFARACGVESSRVSEWLAGAQLPSAEHLRVIAERTGVSLDWLLLGDGGEEPRYRVQSRMQTQSELEADIAEAIVRGIGAPALPADLEANEWARMGALFLEYCPEIDAASILRDAIERARADRDRLLERCCDVFRVVVAGWPFVEERWKALTASFAELEAMAPEMVAALEEVRPVLLEMHAEYGDQMPTADALAELERRIPGIGARVDRLYARWRDLPISTDPMRRARAFVWRRVKGTYVALRRKEGYVGLPTVTTVEANYHALWPALHTLAAEAEAREKAQPAASHALPTFVAGS